MCCNIKKKGSHAANPSSSAEQPCNYERLIHLKCILLVR